jgi:hypothetical protein
MIEDHFLCTICPMLSKYATRYAFASNLIKCRTCAAFASSALKPAARYRFAFASSALKSATRCRFASSLIKYAARYAFASFMIHALSIRSPSVMKPFIQNPSGGFRREVQPRRQHWFLNEKVGFPRPHPRLLLGFQGTKSARREGISSPFNDAGGCTSPQNPGLTSRMGIAGIPGEGTMPKDIENLTHPQPSRQTPFAIGGP